VDLVWGYQLEFLTLNSDLYIITGAGTGLGKECANYFSKNSLVIGTFNKSRFKKKKNLIAHKLDLENKKSIEKFFKKFNKEIINAKKINLICFATYKKDDLLVNVNKKDLNKTFNINVFSNFYFCSKLIPFLLNKKNSIILISSSLGTKGDKGISLYSSSKHALKGIMQSIVSEYSSHGIRCNILSLGFFKSPLWNDLSEKKKKQILLKSPSGKIGKIGNLFKAIKFIQNTEYYNASVLDLDGGFGII